MSSTEAGDLWDTYRDAGPTPARGTAGLVVVSNRLPVRLEDVGGKREWRASPGGLVSALTPVLRGRGGVWVGWSGRPDSVEHPETHLGIELRGVPISASEYDDFYLGFANRTLWPLYHDAIRSASFDRHWWQAYVRVNHRYARAAAEVAAPGATVWVHDYHLQLVPMMLRALRADVRIGFFLHIPFRRRSCSRSCRGGGRSSKASSARTSSASRWRAPR